VIRVFVAHDEALIRLALQQVLEREDDVEFLGSCGGAAVVDSVNQYRPHVVLLGDQPSRAKALASISALHAVAARPKVALLTSSADERFATDALLAGADGLLLRDMSPQNLMQALRVLVSGSNVLAPTVFRAIVDGPLATTPPPELRNRVATLTTREREVLTLLAEGLSNTKIARALMLSHATVKEYISSIYVKLGAANRVQAAVLAHRMGMGDSTGQTVAA
jgi:DNA-binding NarL/FixJ family response regulator